MNFRLCHLFLAFMVPGVVAASNAPAQGRPLVAVASSFRTLWPDLMSAYTERTGSKLPRVSFGSSGLLTTQIKHGAPFELFISADAATIKQLQNDGKTRGAGIPLAEGTLVLVSSSRNNHKEPQTLSSLQKQLNDGSKHFKLALANPRHAPYGAAAKQAMQSTGLWAVLDGHLVIAENASQAYQYVLSGVVDYAIVPTTLVLKASRSQVISAVDSSLYSTVKHQLVLLHSSTPAASQLFDWLQSAPASQIFAAYKLSLPGE